MGKGLSITAFILSFFFPIVGLILGIIALAKAKDDPDAGKGFAIAAIIIGGLWILVLIIIIFVGVGWYMVGNPQTVDYTSNRCFISAPFGCDLVSSTEKVIVLSINNLGIRTVSLNSFEITGCGKVSGQNLEIPRGESGLVIVNCDYPLTQGHLNGDLSIDYSEEGSTFNKRVTGTVYVKTQ